MVLPPTKTLALVEFLEPQDARKAFKSLAYKRFHHVPLYLEWAPKGIFSGPPPKPQPAGAAAASSAAAPAAAAAAPAKFGKAAGKGPSEGVTGLAEAQAADADVESSTVYVKNLPFASDEAALRQHFEEAVAAAGGSIRAVKVAKRKGADGKVLSAGFGFVECSSEDSARGVIQALQSSSLGGHRLVLQLSQQAAGGRGKAGAAAGGKQAGRQAKLQAPDTTKLVVRNVAFEATRKDIMGLFTPFGHVKSCRLPRKFDGTHRCAPWGHGLLLLLLLPCIPLRVRSMQLVGRSRALSLCCSVSSPCLTATPPSSISHGPHRKFGVTPSLPPWCLPQRLCLCGLCHEAGGAQRPGSGGRHPPLRPPPGAGVGGGGGGAGRTAGQDSSQVPGGRGGGAQGAADTGAGGQAAAP